MAPEDLAWQAMPHFCKIGCKPGFHIVILGLRQSFRVVYGRWLFESFGVFDCFPSLVVYGLFVSFWVVNVKGEFSNFTRTMGLERSYRVVVVFPYHFLGRLCSFRVFRIELISISKTQSFGSFVVVCFCFHMVVYGRKKIFKTH